MKELEMELDYVQKRKKVVALGIVALLFIGIIGIVAVVVSMPSGEAQGVHLIVEDVFFVTDMSKGSSTSDTIVLTVTAFITNEGKKDVENVEIVTFVVDKNSNLALDKATITVGTIQKDKTDISEFPLEIPKDNSYIVRLIILVNGKIVVRGSGTITSYDNDDNSVNQYRTDYEEHGYGGVEANYMVPYAITLYFAVGFIIALIILLELAKYSSSKKGQATPNTAQAYENGPNYLEYPFLNGVEDTNEMIKESGD